MQVTIDNQNSGVNEAINNNDLIELTDAKIMFKQPKHWETPNGAFIQHQPFKKFLRTDIRQLFESKGIIDPDLEAREIVAQVFPFKINQFIVDRINWDRYQDDPIFQLTFPQKEMLLPEEINRIKKLKADAE